MRAEWKSLVKEWGSPRSGPAVSGVHGKKGLCDAFAPRVLGKFTGTGRKADCPRSACPPPDDWLISTSLLPGVREPTLSSRLGTWHPPASASAGRPRLGGEVLLPGQHALLSLCFFPTKLQGEQCLLSLFYLYEELALPPEEMECCGETPDQGHPGHHPASSPLVVLAS